MEKIQSDGNSTSSVSVSDIKPPKLAIPPNTDYTVIILGKTGSGKSSILNKLCENPGYFKEGSSLKSETGGVEWLVGTLKSIKDKTCLFVDTPGFYDTENKDKSHIKELIEFLKIINHGFTILIFTFNLTEMRFDSSLQFSIAMLSNLLGEDIYKSTRIVLTFKNLMNEKHFKSRYDIIASELPERLTISGIHGVPHPYYVYDHEGDEYGNLESLIKEIISIKTKVKPEILQYVGEHLDIDDPVKMLKLLNDNTKQMKSYMEKIKNLEALVIELTHRPRSGTCVPGNFAENNYCRCFTSKIFSLK